MNAKEVILNGKAALGIEFGSTRIKAVLIGENHETLALGTHDWENRLVDGIWTYTLEDIWGGLQDCYGSLVKDVREIAGMGIIAQVKNQRVAAGNIKLMAKEGIQLAEIQDSQGTTTIHIAVNGIYGGSINLEDSIKATVPEALTQLRQVGIKKFVLLTGDNSAVAQKVGCRLAIEQVESQLLPGDKVAKLEEILPLCDRLK